MNFTSRGDFQILAIGLILGVALARLVREDIRLAGLVLLVLVAVWVYVHRRRSA